VENYYKTPQTEYPISDTLFEPVIYRLLMNGVRLTFVVFLFVKCLEKGISVSATNQLSSTLHGVTYISGNGHC
jgi:hypothetical protein